MTKRLHHQRIDFESAAAFVSTPGPWLAAAWPSSIVGWPIVGSEGRLICSLSWLGVKPAEVSLEDYKAYYREVQANGHLIETAPDLLASLREMLEIGELFIPAKLDSPGFKRARAAISRAEGR